MNKRVKTTGGAGVVRFIHAGAVLEIHGATCIADARTVAAYVLNTPDNGSTRFHQISGTEKKYARTMEAMWEEVTADRAKVEAWRTANAEETRKHLQAWMDYAQRLTDVRPTDPVYIPAP